MWLVQGAAIYINIAAPCTTEIHTENQHFTLRVKPRVQPRFLHRLLLLCFSCNPVIPKNKKSPKHFPFSVKISIFASVPRAERSNAAKPAQLPNRYRLPNFLLFKSYLPTDYKKTIVFLEKHAGEINQLYCSLPSVRSAEIVPIINYCENHLVRFFSVPNVRNYLKRRMHFELLGNVPVLSIRCEPLESLENRIIKRTFDVICSGLFLITVFPFVYIFFGIAIKLSSPGPVFFKQKRSGEDGREFWCYKFRSMKVNTQCDTLQATENDPRKTRIGEIMRKTSVDELPQFINVLKGDMSIVGPRPHMLKHTEEYSNLINKFMVRHFVKPGITGWAQVTGYRGETKELWQMEGRVQRDIWYIEHWTFLLDLYIMYKTVYNAIRGEKEAY